MSKKQKLPHIVIFNPDQFRSDAVGHLGNEAAVTPCLDRFAREDAVSFRNAFCQNPVCTPSRCSFMSGWYPHVRGHRTMHHMMKSDEPVLLRTLKENGYLVWWGGKNDLIPGGSSFDPYCSVKYKPTRAVKPGLHRDQSWRGLEADDNYYSFYAGRIDTAGENVYYDSDWAYVEGAIDLIRNAEDDQPLCIYLPLLYPHPPYGVEDPWYSSISRASVAQHWERSPTPAHWHQKPSLLKGIYERQRLMGWSEERWTELRATYLGMCARIDEQFGRVMQALREKGIYEDTAVFFFSDHGDFTGDYGLVEKTQNTFEDCLTKVPFLVKPQAGVPVKPGVRDALVELIDFPATVEALTGIAPTHTHFGKSLLPLMNNDTQTHRDAVFCEGGRMLGEIHCAELEMEHNTVPSGLYWPRVGLQNQEGPEHTKAVMCRTERYKYVKRVYEQDELYDLWEDPRELVNRIDDPVMANVVSRMKERLLDFYVTTADVVPHDTDQR